MWVVWTFFVPLPDFAASSFESDPITMLLSGYVGLVTIAVCGIAGKKWSRKFSGKPSFLSGITLSPGYLQMLSWVILLAGIIAAFSLFDGFSKVPLLAAEGKDLVRSEMASKSSGFAWLFYMMLIFIPTITYMKSPGKFRTWTIIDIIKNMSAIVLLSLYGGRFFMMSPIVILILLHMHYVKVSMKKIGIFFIIAIAFSMWFIGFRIYGSEVDVEQSLRAFVVDFFPEMRMFASAIMRVTEHSGVSMIFQNIVMGNIPSKLADLLDLNKQELFRPIGTFTSDLFPEFGGLLGIRLSWIGEWYITGGIVAVIIATAVVSFIVGYFDEKILANSLIHGKLKYIVLSFFYTMLIPYGTNFIVTIVWMHVMVFILFSLFPDMFNKVIGRHTRNGT